MENQMVRAIIFGKLQNVEAFLGDAIFPLLFTLFSLCGYTLKQIVLPPRPIL